MNSGGGGAYNKVANRRKPSSLMLSRPNPTPGASGAVLLPGASRNVRTVSTSLSIYCSLSTTVTVLEDHPFESSAILGLDDRTYNDLLNLCGARCPIKSLLVSR